MCLNRKALQVFVVLFALLMTGCCQKTGLAAAGYNWKPGRNTHNDVDEAMTASYMQSGIEL